MPPEVNWELSQGDKVRLFDIRVPPPEKGGIFNKILGRVERAAERSIALIEQLERGYLDHCGHVFPKWVEYFLSRNLAKEIVMTANDFVRHVGAERHGWQKRFAQKFGLVYAAMAINVKAGILPWPKELPLKVATKCYRRAQNGAMNEADIARYLAGKLYKTMGGRNRLIDAPNAPASEKALKRFTSVHWYSLL